MDDRTPWFIINESSSAIALSPPKTDRPSPQKQIALCQQKAIAPLFPTPDRPSTRPITSQTKRDRPFTRTIAPLTNKSPSMLGLQRGRSGLRLAGERSLFLQN